jgi:hypothetical protein
VRLGDGGSLDLKLMVDTGAGYFSAGSAEERA